MPHSKNSKEIVDASKTHASTESSGGLRCGSCRPCSASSPTCGGRPGAVAVNDAVQISFTVEAPHVGGESPCSTSSTGTPTL
jgi:hypothetical protein